LASGELIDYYQRRAREYEAIYAKPERQADLAVLRQEVAERLTGRRVLSFMSQVDPLKGLGVEVFVLEPLEADSDGR
jgi:uncharacterized protein YbcI